MRINGLKISAVKQRTSHQRQRLGALSDERAAVPSAMDSVQLFQQEVRSFCVDTELDLILISSALYLQLSSLYEMKPPISKAKMNAITKSAIKSIKMYKHVVLSVERFIAKVCTLRQHAKCCSNFRAGT